jgi:hypothetical protein
MSEESDHSVTLWKVAYPLTIMLNHFREHGGRSSQRKSQGIGPLTCANSEVS